VEAQLDALYGVALRLTRNSTDAEDLVSESVAKAWYAIETQQDWEAFRGWIFRIMRNHFLSGYRKASQGPDFVQIDRPVGEDNEPDLAPLLFAQSDEFLNWWADPEKEIIGRLLGDKITAAVQALPDVFQLTILLVIVDGLRYDEAAEILGVPPGTVRSRMKRGRTLLQKALWEEAKDAGLIDEREAVR
jgi:RNA polymerase sigma-70 factor (ECF subfamily)